MNDKLKINQFLITVSEQMPGRFMANSILDDETTANIMMQLAINFYRKAAVKKHEESKIRNGAIINPITGLTMPVKKEKGN